MLRHHVSQTNVVNELFRELKVAGHSFYKNALFLFTVHVNIFIMIMRKYMYAANKPSKKGTQGKAEKSAQKLSVEIYSVFGTIEISLDLSACLGVEHTY